jgi:hypothetical protein
LESSSSCADSVFARCRDCARSPGSFALRARLHQQPKNLEARFLRQRRKALDGIRHFHISMIPEMMKRVKPSARLFC